jgi:hypothetical protein
MLVHDISCLSVKNMNNYTSLTEYKSKIEPIQLRQLVYGLTLRQQLPKQVKVEKEKDHTIK